MACKMCKERGKDWDGDDPRCAFDGDFADNWNCATLNAIRVICYEGQHPMPDGVAYTYCDDMKYATIRISEVDGIDGLALYVEWYKSRGTTDAVWLLGGADEPRQPTEEECLAVISHFDLIGNA